MPKAARRTGSRPRIDPALVPLGQRGWLSMTAPSFLSEVQHLLEIKHFKPGQRIYTIGDGANGLWGTLDGVVEFEIATMRVPGLAHFGGLGFWFGEGAVIAKGAKRETGAHAMTACTLATLSMANCYSILNKDPGRWQWIALLSLTNRNLILRRTRELLFKSPHRRVAAALLRLCGAGTDIEDTPISSILLLKQQELATVAGLSRTIVNEILKSFEESGIVTSTYRRLEVTDWALLKNILDQE